ncbi:MAG: hypothetical protein U0T75_15030 [Chitinophagales bacterium]
METNNQSSSKEKKAGIAIIIALLLISGTAIYFVASQNTENKKVTAEKTQLQNEFNDLSKTLDAKTAELEEFRGKNADLDKQITAKQEEIQKQKEEITALLHKGKLTTGELNKTRALVAQYEASIAEMQSKVDQLTQQNLALTTTNTDLTNQLTAEKTVTSQQTEMIAGLNKKVEVGSLLQLKSLDVVAVKDNALNGKEREVKKAKRAEAIKISFETGENHVIDPGTVPIYVRVINPKGETIAVADEGAGTIKTETGEMVQYTKEADINYDQTNKKVNVYLSQQIQQPGTYKVEVYQNGHMIGKDELALN